jgi:hypothetical protein
MLVFPAPNRSVPEKRKQQISPTHNTKRGRLDFGGPNTPSKQVHFFSSPRCPPSPHHKPRASSPLRASAISPHFVIKRPERRTPLGPLTITLQGHGGTSTRSPSKNFKLFESPSPKKQHVSLSPSQPVSPTRMSNNKENIPPFIKESMKDDPFVRPQPRGPLTRLKRLDQDDSSDVSDVVETETKVRIEETITTEYFAGAKIITETMMKESVVNEIMREADSDDTHMSNIPWQRTNWDFDIYNDEPEDLEMLDYNTTVDNIMLEAEEDKENEDPGVSTGEAEIEERMSRYSKQKHQEDWS